jgi:hypothetical protein
MSVTVLIGMGVVIGLIVLFGLLYLLLSGRDDEGRHRPE